MGFYGIQCEAVLALGADLKTAAPIGSRIDPAMRRMSRFDAMV